MYAKEEEQCLVMIVKQDITKTQMKHVTYIGCARQVTIGHFIAGLI